MPCLKNQVSPRDFLWTILKNKSGLLLVDDQPQRNFTYFKFGEGLEMQGLSKLTSKHISTLLPIYKKSSMPQW